MICIVLFVNNSFFMLHLLSITNCTETIKLKPFPQYSKIRCIKSRSGYTNRTFRTYGSTTIITSSLYNCKQIVVPNLAVSGAVARARLNPACDLGRASCASAPARTWPGICGDNCCCRHVLGLPAELVDRMSSKVHQQLYNILGL